MGSHNLVFATKNGVVKKTSLAEYARVPSKGKKAIILRDNDSVVGVAMTDGNSEILLASHAGRAIRFNESTLRTMGRVSTGVRGMNLVSEDNKIIGLIALEPNTSRTILALSEKGIGKRSLLDDYRITNRGGKGVKTININEKTGLLVAFTSVSDEEDLVIINKSGITMRLHLADVPVRGRATMGVRIIDLRKRGDDIASVCVVDADQDEEVEQVAPEALEQPSLSEEEGIDNELDLIEEMPEADNDENINLDEQ